MTEQEKIIVKVLDRLRQVWLDNLRTVTVEDCAETLSWVISDIKRGRVS